MSIDRLAVQPADRTIVGDVRWEEKRCTEDFFRILDPEGRLHGQRPAVSDEEMVRWYAVLVETRALEALGIRMQRRGEISVAAKSLGEEAVGLGAAAALRKGDWCFPSYRQTSALLYWNVPLDRMFAGMMGAPPEHIAEHLPLLNAGLETGVNFVPFTIFLGASIPHAVGSALADQLNGRDTVTLAFLGDGATSEGDFYEGINIAGVLKVPLVVVVQNNQWSISVPACRQTAARTFTDKALAAGLRHARVDGNDPFAVYVKTQEAVALARSRGGPTLIEAVTYRMDDHNTADSAVLYRNDHELTYWKARDPLQRLQRYLNDIGLLDDAKQVEIESAATERLRAARDRARKVPPAPPSSMFANHLIGAAGWAFEQQHAELALEREGQNPYVLQDSRGGGPAS